MNPENNPEQKSNPVYQHPQNQPAHPTQPAPHQIVQEKTDTLGILSVVMPFIGFALLGLIFGIIGEKKAKKEGRSPILSRIGWIISLIMVSIGVIAVALIITAVPATQKNVRDTSRKNDISLLRVHLENFYNTNKHYPSALTELKTEAKLSDPRGKRYVYTPSPVGCVQCTGYTLSTSLEDGGTYELRSSD